jgi:F-type H+-transporting ATPase subunit b
VLIDWFTVGAQVVNFLILVLLLKRFLYGPILRAMESREERLAGRFAEAEEALQQARQAEAELRRQQQELEEARGQRLRAVEEEAEQRRKELMTATREETAALRAAWLEALRREQELFGRELKKRVGSEILHIARKSLADLSDVELEERLVERFTAGLAELESEARQKLAAAGRDDGLTVRSSFELPDRLRSLLTEGLQHVLQQPVETHFELDPELPLGIELAVGGLKLSWGVDHYFETLQEAVGELFQSQLGAPIDEGPPPAETAP